MAPRKRSSKNKDLPDNLYESRGYYRYRHPLTKKEHPMGTDRRRAIQAANKLNLRLVPPQDLVADVLRSGVGTVADAVRRYREERQSFEGLEPSTLKLENYRLNAIEKGLGHLPCPDLTIKACAEWLDGFVGNAYTKHRGTLIKVTRFAMAKGLFADVDRNPAEGTLTNPRTAEEKKRKPLTRAGYDDIYAIAPDWFQVAMDVALITLQRRGDLVKARYTDIEGDTLTVIQNKTKKHGHRAFLKIQIGETLGRVIQRSRQIRPVCPFIIHRMPERKRGGRNLEHFAQITPDYLSKTFGRLRDSLPQYQAMHPDERPTFHEIRGLGGKLYLDAGYGDDYVNLLMGHTSQRMTDQYTDQHQEWTLCGAELDL